MPNLNPNPSDQINISGNTFTVGATLPGTPTMGSVIYNITGIEPGISYYFSVVSFSDISGYSGWAGPIVVYIQPEIRQAINAYSWQWPHTPIYGIFDGVDYTVPRTQYSNTYSNLLYLSNQTQVKEVWGRATIGTAPIVIKTTAISGPISGINVTAIQPTSTDYINISQTVYNLQPGTTYTYSFYYNIDGLTSSNLQYRISHAAGLTTYIKQIEPVSQPNFNLTESYSTSSIKYVTYPSSGATGWQRFVAQFATNTGQTYSSFSIFAGNFSTGKTAYIAAPQVAIGTAAGPFVSTAVIGNWEGVCGDDDKWLAFGNSYGLTYISPTLAPTSELVAYQSDPSLNPLVYAEGFAQSNTIARTSKLLKLLPENKRAILPTYFFTDDLWYFYDDSLNYANPAGVTYTFFKNYYDTIQTNQRFPTIWSDSGVTYGKAFWNSILNTLSATGATFDYLISNAEMYGAYDSFSTLYPGLTTAMTTGDKAAKYTESYLGLTSWSDWMNSLGASINNVMIDQVAYPGNSSGKFDYMVWNGINRAHELRTLNAVFEDTLSLYPKSTLSEYEWSYITDGNPVDGPNDGGGHPQYWKYYFGNAAAPQLYGIISGIATAWGVCGADPSYLYFAPYPATTGSVPGPPEWKLKDGDTRPANNAWTSFLMGVQQVRSAKRATPNLPITPWIASVKTVGYSGLTEIERPPIGFADVNLGYNPQQGITLTVAGGNSAYYYEMVRHVMLTGCKGLLYWNARSFEDQRIDGNYLIKFASGQGATGFIDDMQKLNNVIGDVNDKIGGFTPITADSKRLSWLAPYVASGAPGPNGITWWWRITTNPGNTTFVNGQTLSVSNNNIVGTWVTTSGPTLGGVVITHS